MIITDELTPIERSAALNSGKSVDRLPCVPIVGNTAARVARLKVSSLRGRGDLIAMSQVLAYRTFKYDNIRIFTDLFQQAEAMGATVYYPQDETAYLQTPAISTVDEIKKLKPADPYKDGNLPEYLKAIKITLDEVGKEVPVSGAVVGPFTNAAFLIGTETFTKLLNKNPQAAHDLIRVSLETAIAYSDAVIDAGGTPSITDAMSSSSVISPRQFKEFSYPYLKELIDSIHKKSKKSVTLHICGKTEKIWELMVEAGADCLSIDDAADLELAKKQVGQKVKLFGNIKPSEVMLEGNEKDVFDAVYTCVKKAHDSPKGYIVGSGCSLPTDTSFTNIFAMMNAVRKIGYPVNLER